MSRETTLRQLIYKCNKEIFKEQGLTRSELQDLTTYVLSTAAVSKLTPDEMFITEGNMIGLGVCNYDRKISIPRFIVYEFGNLGVFELLGGKQKSYKLKSAATFDELENYLIYSTNSVAVVVDGEILKYQKVGDKGWGWEIVWSCDTYIITYISEDLEQKEILRSKQQLQTRLLQIVVEGSTEIQAYNILSGERLDFIVRKDIYTTKATNGADGLCLIWCKDMREDDEEEVVF